MTQNAPKPEPVKPRDHGKGHGSPTMSDNGSGGFEQHTNPKSMKNGNKSMS